MKTRVALVVLYAYVAVFAIYMGGGIYEDCVTVSLWTSDPPHSARVWKEEGERATLKIDPGRSFWMITTPLLGLLTIATIATSFLTHGAHRKWRLFSSTAILLVLILTAFYYVPELMRMFGPDSASLSDTVLAKKVEMWKLMNHVREVIAIVAFFAALRALQLSPQPRTSNSTETTWAVR